MWYSEQDRYRNGVGVIMDEWTSKDIAVELCKKDDRIIFVKIVYGKDILNVISAYALQVEIEKLTKRKF